MWDSCLIEGVPTIKCLEVLFELALKSISGIVFIILLAMFFIGSLSWMTAGDNAEKLKKAKGTILSAIIGLVIIALSYLIIQILQNFLDIPSLDSFQILD